MVLQSYNMCLDSFYMIYRSFVIEKCRHNYPEANHAFSFYLCCLSDVNFEVELSEKLGFYLVPNKIHAHIWFIV